MEGQNKAHRRECQDLDQLKRVAFEEWEKITPNDIQRIIRSIPRRLVDIVRSDGGHIKY